MVRDNSQQAYSVAVGTSPTNFAVIDQRDPTSNDIYYPIGKFWINQQNKALWYLNSQSNVTGSLQSTWELLSIGSALVSLSDTGNANIVFPSLPSDTPPDNIQIAGGTGITVTGNTATHTLTITNTGSGTETLTGDDGIAVSPTAGTILLEGKVVTNATHAKAVFTETSGAVNQENIDVQVSAAIAATDVTKVGLSAFSDAQFGVDSNGFVTLKGGTTAPILGVHPDAHTAPGTDPVVPDGSGNIKLEGGATFATGTQANPIRTNSLAANTIDFQIQLAGSNAAASTPNDFGVAQFDANQFVVTSGFVQVKNSGTTGVVTEIIGDDSLAVVPAAGTGAITLDGVVVTNATHAKPVFFAKNAASTEELDVQVTTTSTSGAKNINNSGLASFDSAFFTVDGPTGFVSLSSSGATETLTGDDGVAVSPSGGTIQTLGNTVANSTHAKPLFTTNSSGNIERWDIQVAAAIASTDINKTGLAAFSNAQFGVDANGFVTLSGGTTAPILGVHPDAHTSPGTDPVIPDGSGNIKIEGGATFATGTQANPIRTNSLAANTIDLQIQLAGSNTGSSTANDFGVAQFDSNQFAVTSGFVQLKGGGTAPALTKLAMDAGTSPVVPDSTGQITLTAAQVATGVVGANVIRSDGTGANTCTLQIQRTTVSAGADSTKNGVCHFNSSQFSVDANGFVQAIAIGTFPWTDEGGNFNAASNNGYFCTAALTATLPGSPAQGDVVRVVADTASVVTVAANTGQKIRLGNVIGANAGSAVSTRQGDAIDLVYRSASATWYAFEAPVGTWGIS